MNYERVKNLPWIRQQVWHRFVYRSHPWVLELSCVPITERKWYKPWKAPTVHNEYFFSAYHGAIITADGHIEGGTFIYLNEDDNLGDLYVELLNRWYTRKELEEEQRLKEFKERFL